MRQRVTMRSGDVNRRHFRLATIAMAAVLSMALAFSAAAQEEEQPEELSAIDAIRAELDACIDSGASGADCAETVRVNLSAIIGSGPATSISDGTSPAANPDAGTTPATSPGDGVTGGADTSSASGADGERSRGGDGGQVVNDDASGNVDVAMDSSSTNEPAPADESAAADEAAPPSDIPEEAATDEAAAPAGEGTTSATSDPGAENVIGGIQMDDASGTSGDSSRQR